MSGRGGNKDGRVAHAVAFLLRCQGASVPEAMRAAKFTLEESSNTTKQMAVRRAYTKAIGGKTKSPFSVSVDVAANTSSLLPLTEPTPTTRTSVSRAMAAARLQQRGCCGGGGSATAQCRRRWTTKAAFNGGGGGGVQWRLQRSTSTAVGATDRRLQGNDVNCYQRWRVATAGVSV